MINRMMLSDQIREELLHRIITGKYRPGDRLVESQIAKEMGTSQSPVREALRDLAAMRFIEISPYKGARVREVDPAEVLEIYPVRAALEELAGRLAVDRMRDRIGELVSAMEAMNEAAERNDVHTIVSMDVEFHRIILDATGNRLLTETWNSLMIGARTFVTATSLLITDVGVRRIGEMHQPIIDAFRSGDRERCGAVMREHVEAFAAAMEKVYQNDAKNRRSVDAGAQRDEVVSRHQAHQHRNL